MSQLIHQIAFYLHIAAGSLALIVFWLPMFAKKGDKNHRRFGRLFVNGMYAVSLSGFLMTLLVLTDPIAVRMPTGELTPDKTEAFIYRNRIFAGFLFMLSILVFSNVRQSILVLKAKEDRNLLKHPLHLSLIAFLGLAGSLVGWIAFSRGILLLQIFSILSVVNAIGMFYYIYKPRLKKREWIIAHLGNIIGAGIGAYTAFFAFGGSRLFVSLLSGNMMVIPWVLPGLIGTIGSIYLSKKYRQQFSVS